MRVVCNNFVLRQTRHSQFSHWEGAPHMMAGRAQLEALVAEHWEGRVLSAHAPGQAPKGPVYLVDVPARGFYCPITELVVGNDDISAQYAPRRAGEAAFVQLTADGAKMPAKHVTIVVYSREALGDDATSKDGAEFEIVTINARVTEAPEPMHPFTMARNALEMTGGTLNRYTGEEWARATVFWSQHALVTPGDHHDHYGYTL